MHLMDLMPDLVSYDDESKPVIKHECRVTAEKDEVDEFIKGNNLFSRFNRWFTRKRVLLPSHYYAQSYLKSTTAIKFEIKKHLHEFPYMIHPFSPLRNFWDIVMVLFTLTALILTPFLNTFYFENPIPVIGYLMVIDFIMLLDIILQFFTGYFDRTMKRVTLDPRIVFIKYITGFFILDILSAIPIEVIDFLIHGNTHINWYYSALNFAKLFRIRNLFHYVDHMHRSYQISFQIIKIVQISIILIVTLHWAACLVYYVPLVVLKFDGVDDANSKSWILCENMQKRDSMFEKYILCLNRATISLVSSSHYLDVNTAEDMIMNFTLAFLGKIGFIYLLSQFIQLILTIHFSNKERLRLLQQLQDYMQYKELPIVIQKKLLEYCNYWCKKHFNRDKYILAQVSEPLRKELIFHNYMKLLETVEMFKLLPQDAIEKLVMFIVPEIYLSSDIIVKFGTPGDSMYFVGSGTVAVYTSFGKEVCHLEDGAYFGEVALVMENEQRIASVVAIETCEILQIQREAFLQILSSYPNLLSRLQKLAFERLGKTVPLDEIYRQEDVSPNYINISNINGRKRY